MRKYTVLLVFLSMVACYGYGQEKRSLEDTLTHHLQPWEAKLMENWNEAFYVTPPPTGPVRNVAECNRMNGVLIRYPFGLPMSVIKEMANDAIVTTIVTGTSQENTVRSQYINNGVNLANCNFLHAPTNSYWTRDYGPWFVFDGNDQPGIVNFPYNRPRPYDNDIPIKVAEFLNIDLYGMNILHTGGNYMTDGMGISASTDLVWSENSSLSHAQIDQLVLDYLGVHTYHVVPDPNNTYIDHIDCWAKYLDVDKILVREVPVSHPQYNAIEASAAYFAAQTTSYGTPLQVYRVYTPNNEPYTNSLILNHKVLVPLKGTAWDNAALQSYQNAMPGYEVYGFVYSGWASTDALHCRTKGMADIGMLYIEHIPVEGNAPVLAQYQIDAKITAHSGQTIYPDSVLIVCSVNEGPFSSITMTHLSGKNYTGIIPGPPEGSKVEYYLYAADASGRRETHPFIGVADAHTFYVGQPLYPDIEVTPSEVYASCPVGSSVTEQITISNVGQFFLNYQISCSVSKSEVLTINIPDSPAKDTYTYNTFNETGWGLFEINQTGIVEQCEISFQWNTDDWAYEGALYLESPSGSAAVVATGCFDGEYTVSLDCFNGEEMNGAWKLLIQDSDGDGGHQATNVSLAMKWAAPLTSWLSVTPETGSVDPSEQEMISVICDASSLAQGTYEGAISIASNDPDSPEIVVPVHFSVSAGYLIDIKVFLEGPFSSTEMITSLNSQGYLPLQQPYQAAPWNYNGTEAVAAMPNSDIVDWVLVELRDAPNADSANASTTVQQYAAFLLRNGLVRGMDASGLLFFNQPVAHQLYAVIIHRNHLDVMTANPLILNGNTYSYDFTVGSMQAFGGNLAQKQIVPGIWAMRGGDGDGDRQVTNGDKNDVWASQAGFNGYYGGDYNLDGGVNNGDKNDVWIPNSGLGSQVP